MRCQSSAAIIVKYNQETSQKYECDTANSQLLMTLTQGNGTVGGRFGGTIVVSKTACARKECLTLKPQRADTAKMIEYEDI